MNNATVHEAGIGRPTVVGLKFLPFLLLLALIAILGILFRYFLDNSGQYMKFVYLDRSYAGIMPQILADKPFWYFFLPIPEFKGVWATTGFVPIYFLETSIGPNWTYLLLSATATVGFGIGCWMTFRRLLPSAFAAFALTFSPFNYMTYIWNGSNNAYLTITFLSLAWGFYFSFCFHERRRSQLALGTAFLVLAALSYEIWLNAVAALFVMTPFIAAFLRRHDNRETATRYFLVFGIVVAIASIYIIIRARTLRGTAISGSEFQLIWDHLTAGPVFDDLVFNLISLYYMCVAQILPGFVGTSLAIYESAKLDIATMQQGYQPELYPIVASHYLNLWMIYAAAAYVMTGVLAFVALRKGIRIGSIPYFVAGLVCVALLFGSATYVILKFVPFGVTPIHTYKITVALMVVYLAAGYFVDLLVDYFRSCGHGWHAFSAGLCIVYILLVAFTRPAAVNENLLEIWGEQGLFGLGFFPDPWANFKILTRSRVRALLPSE